MCGIFGFEGIRDEDALLGKMAKEVRHRGPDDEGFYSNNGTGLGMCRLSIIDVEGGHQPILNEDKSIILVANGEIYNYKELSDELTKKGHRFSTRSDVEVIVHLYEEYGEDCVNHLRGMFAFAVYDQAKNKLLLARDRLGIKPLYYWEGSGSFLFSSEMKALLQADCIARTPYMPAIDAYMTLRYVPGPETMIDGIRKVPAGHLLMRTDKKTVLKRYWAPVPHKGGYEKDGYYHERFRDLFRESVKMRLMSDVPLGAYLSGGVDSSAIVATMSGMMDRPVKTFSVGFDWEGDELTDARFVAEAVGAEHHEITCKYEDLGSLPKIIWHLDEPIGDAIVVPMYLLSKLAREHVKVILTGEGADETLAGYLPHKVMNWAKQYSGAVPKIIRDRILRNIAGLVPASVFNAAFSYPGTLGEKGKKKVLNYMDLLGNDKALEEYTFLISLFGEEDKAGLYTSRLQEERWHLNGAKQDDGGSFNSYLDRILHLQYGHWLQDDILMKQDKMSMGNSVEGRVPFMDHKLVEFLLTVPSHLKLSAGTDKKLLRDYLGAQLPKPVSRRRKKSFYIPVDQYFGKGPLHDMVEECLSEKSIRKRGYFRWEEVRDIRNKVSKGEFLYGKQVLSLLALELWHRLFIDREPGWA